MFDKARSSLASTMYFHLALLLSTYCNVGHVGESCFEANLCRKKAVGLFDK